jgi:4-hydroxybenzoate polyprenyltransferase
MASDPGTVRSLLRLLSCIRLVEVVALQGSPLLGALFSIGRITTERGMALLPLAAGSCCLVAHVFVLNDWCGMSTDLRDPNRSTGVFTTKGIGHSEIGYLWAALFALSLLMFSLCGSQTLVIALVIAGLSALYSAPAFHMKGVPLLSSALHFIAGLLHFLLGYSLFSAIDWRGLEIGCFFALVFVAGHLTHEARDREGDLLNAIRTNAVMFGKARSFAAGLVVFTIADVLLVVLAARGIAPRPLVLVAALYPLHFYWSLRTWRAGLTFESIRRFQVRYRALYATIGIMMVATLLLAH